MKRFLPLWVGLVAVGLVAWAVLRPSPPVVETAPLAHYAEFDRLVGAAWRGDRPMAAVVARDLTAGPEGQGDPVAEDRLGGALGFVGFAEDGAELADAVATAAAACGDCHATLEVPAPPRVGWSHPTAGEWLAWGLVWGPLARPPGDDPRLAAVLEALDSEVAEDSGAPADAEAVRVGRAWAVCAGCHERHTELPED